MLMLDLHTWIRFAVWMVIGLPTYYFSVRPYTEAQNKNVSNKSSIDYNINMVQNSTQIAKLNGLSNIAFVNDENVFEKESEKEEDKDKPRKKSASQPPIIIQEQENKEIQQEIAKLDEMLEEASHFIDTSLIDRKLSVGTMSNVYNVVLHEESVVALVHHDNVTPATPPSSPTDKHKNISSLVQNITVDNIKNNLNDKFEEKQNENITEVIGDIPSAVITQNEVQSNMSEFEMFSKQPTTENSPIEKDVTSEDVVEVEENIIKEKSEASDEPVIPPIPPPPQNVSMLIENKSKNELIPVPPSLPSPHILKEVTAIPRPTSANLASVVLKRPQRDLKNQVEEKPYEPPDDDNLKVGSEKYKYFKSKLTGTLQKLNVLPNYIPYIKKNTHNGKVSESNKNNDNTQKKQINENIIEESIDQKEVIKRIGNIISNTRLNGFPGANPLLKNELSNKEKMDNVELGITKEGEPERDENKFSDNDYVKHKSKMQNVFRSINLKKIESFKDSEPKESRNARSLGSSYKYDDKFYHRQAMSEIFKSIKLRRKDSGKEKDTVN